MLSVNKKNLWGNEQIIIFIVKDISLSLTSETFCVSRGLHEISVSRILEIKFLSVIQNSICRHFEHKPTTKWGIIKVVDYRKNIKLYCLFIKYNKYLYTGLIL